MPQTTPTGAHKWSYNQSPDWKSALPHAFAMKAKKSVRMSDPFCDKIQLIGAITISDLAWEQDKDPLNTLKLFRLEVSKTLLTSKKVDPDLAFAQSARIKGFDTGSVQIADSVVHFSIARKLNDSKTGYAFRIDFNPNAIGGKGLNEIEAFFEIICLGCVHFDTWLGRANYSRLDVTIDAVGISVTEIFIRQKKPLENGGASPARGIDPSRSH